MHTYAQHLQIYRIKIEQQQLVYQTQLYITHVRMYVRIFSILTHRKWS